jgi:hypothetical protein
MVRAGRLRRATVRRTQRRVTERDRHR